MGYGTFGGADKEAFFNMGQMAYRATGKKVATLGDLDRALQRAGLDRGSWQYTAFKDGFMYANAHANDDAAETATIESWYDFVPNAFGGRDYLWWVKAGAKAYRYKDLRPGRDLGAWVHDRPPPRPVGGWQREAWDRGYASEQGMHIQRIRESRARGTFGSYDFVPNAFGAIATQRSFAAYDNATGKYVGGYEAIYGPGRGKRKFIWHAARRWEDAEYPYSYASGTVGSESKAKALIRATAKNIAPSVRIERNPAHRAMVWVTDSGGREVGTLRAHDASFGAFDMHHHGSSLGPADSVRQGERALLEAEQGRYMVWWLPGYGLPQGQKRAIKFPRYVTREEAAVAFPGVNPRRLRGDGPNSNFLPENNPYLK